jgi:hypothetical protein
MLHLHCTERSAVQVSAVLLRAFALATTYDQSVRGVVRDTRGI